MRCLLAAVVVVAGCGDNIPTVAFDEFESARRAAECERLVRCGLFADSGTCVAYFRPSGDADIRAAVNAGRMQYNAAAAYACNVAVASMSCDQTAGDVREAAAACEDIFTGALEVEDECAFDLECASGECDEPSCGTDTCCYGRCLTAVTSAVDEPCDVDRHCIGDAYCGADHVCDAWATTGDQCANDLQCEPGLACIGPSEFQPGTCRALPALGESCPYMRCAEINAICNAFQICVPLGAAGAACASNVECSEFRSCDPMTSRCIETPSLGMPCTVRCAGEAYCAVDGGSLGTCVVPQANGAPCASFDQCASRFCAEGQLFDVCAARPVCF